MNSKKIIIVSLALFIGLFCCLYNNDNKENELSDTHVIKNKDAISMLLETESGSGKYVESTESTYPTSGYKFNATLSKCENGGTLSWDDTTKKIVFSGITSDRCYIYFDKE